VLTLLYRSSSCPNAFPSATNYRTLTQADVDKAKPGRGVRVVAATMSEVDQENLDGSTSASIHPVAAVMGIGHPVAYMPANVSNILEEGSHSGSEDSVSHAVTGPTGAANPLKAEAPL
jgi:hypothetical protein